MNDADTPKILKLMRNRVQSMLKEASVKDRPMVKMQCEELNHYIEMLEKRLGTTV